jgi:hypothetical protein
MAALELAFGRHFEQVITLRSLGVAFEYPEIYCDHQLILSLTPSDRPQARISGKAMITMIRIV